MITFRWKTVLRHSKKSSRRLLAIMKYITHRPIPKDQFDINYQFTHRDWEGSSFLANPEDLFANRWKYPDKNLVEYIGLASLRNVSDYRMLGDKTLDLMLVSKYEELIKNNSLLWIEGNKVYFKYEEVTKEKKRHGN